MKYDNWRFNCSHSHLHPHCGAFTLLADPILKCHAVCIRYSLSHCVYLSRANVIDLWVNLRWFGFGCAMCTLHKCISIYLRRRKMPQTGCRLQHCKVETWQWYEPLRIRKESIFHSERWLMMVRWALYRCQNATMLHIPECPSDKWHVVSAILLLHRLCKCEWHIACGENIFGSTWLCVPLPAEKNFWTTNCYYRTTHCVCIQTHATHTHTLTRRKLEHFVIFLQWILNQMPLARRGVVAHHVAAKVARAECWHSNVNHISLSLSLALAVVVRLLVSCERVSVCVGCRCV